MSPIENTVWLLIEEFGKGGKIPPPPFPRHGVVTAVRKCWLREVDKWLKKKRRVYSGLQKCQGAGEKNMGHNVLCQTSVYFLQDLSSPWKKKLADKTHKKKWLEGLWKLDLLVSCYEISGSGLIEPSPLFTSTVVTWFSWTKLGTVFECSVNSVCHHWRPFSLCIYISHA